jgi:hypothetical protein
MFLFIEESEVQQQTHVFLYTLKCEVNETGNSVHT